MIEFKEPDVLLRDIPGYEKYQISELGDVYNKKTGRKIKTYVRKGYTHIKINKDSFSYHFKIHRLLATIFIENPMNKKIVDHINRNKLDNNLNNLRWVDNSENLTNVKISSRNKSGVIGVYKREDYNNNCWIGYIKKNGKVATKNFAGTIEGFNKAVEWRKQKEKELHNIL